MIILWTHLTLIPKATHCETDTVFNQMATQIQYSTRMATQIQYSTRWLHRYSIQPEWLHRYSIQPEWLHRYSIQPDGYTYTVFNQMATQIQYSTRWLHRYSIQPDGYTVNTTKYLDHIHAVSYDLWYLHRYNEYSNTMFKPN